MAKVISLFKTDPHQIVSTLINKLTGFIETELDKTFIDDAWSLFADENQAFPGEDDPILDLFVPWMLFNFPMDSWDKTFEFGIDEEYSLAEYCMIRSKIPFNLEEKRIINESINRPYTFYEISKSSGKNELELQDLMLGKKL